MNPDQQDDALRWLLGGRQANRSTVERGYRRCEMFTWDATATATIDAYRAALKHR
jgi:glycosyltransferase involved in cell wall biosynthesis